MGSILVVATSKGGGGKSALTACLAVNLAAQGYDVHVVDTDSNQSFAAWHRTYEGPPLTCSSETAHERVVGHVLERAKAHDVVLVDTAGFANQTAAFAMGTADLVLIPVMADRASATAAAKTAQRIVSLSQMTRRDIPHRVVRMRWKPAKRAAAMAMQDLAEAGLVVLDQHIPDLTVFEQYTFTGAMPSTGMVGLQVDRLIAEISPLASIPVAA
jgi:chromosome partitioning protein